MKHLYRTFVLAAIAATGCSHGSTVPPIDAASKHAEPLAVGGVFQEYTLPSYTYGVSSLAAGPSNTVWFVCSTKVRSAFYALTPSWSICEMSPTGAVTGFASSVPAPTVTYPYHITQTRFWTDPIASSAAGYVWYEGEAAYSTSFCGSLCRTGPTLHQAYVIRRAPGGTAVLFSTGYRFANVIAAPNGTVWMSGDNAILTMAPSSSSPPSQTAQLPAGWYAIWMSCRYNPCSSSDPYVYVLANGGAPSPSAAVFKLAMNGQVVQTYALPTGSDPRSITAGPDANLWITERYGGTGPSQVARLQPSTRTVTQFTISASNAGLGAIANAEGSLSFTESNVNAIGRLTVSGAVSGVPVPTPSSQPNGIIPCPSAICGTTGGVWFAETAANKIARYDF